MGRALLIVNPVAKRFSRKRLKEAIRLLSKGFDLDLIMTSFKGEAEAIARDSLNKGYSIVIAAGGDGTFNEVINGLALTGMPLSILPMGTTNVLAKELGIEEGIEKAVRRIIKGREHILSLGLISLQSPPLNRYFCLMAGIGFDGEAVSACNDRLKRPLGKGAYILSGLKTLFRFSPEPLTFSFDSRSIIAYSAIIGKAAKYGGDFRITPDASLFEKDLYIYLMQGKRRIDILRYVLSIILGKHLGLKDITYSRAIEITIEGKAKVQIDGDYIGHTPATVRVIPEAIRMVY